MKKIFSISMLIIGTIIGAGFASGRELLSFFGSGMSVWLAFLCGGAMFGLCALFLWLGSHTGAKNVSELNMHLIGRFHFIPDSFLLLNSLVVLSGMLAGMDSLGGMFFNLSPLYAIVSGILCALVVYKGIRGLLNCNSIIVPAIIASLLIVCIFSIASDNINLSLGSFTVTTLPTALVYVCMNMILASTVLTTMGKLSKKEILLSSGIAAGIMTALLLVLILSLNSYGNPAADMPVLEMAKAIHPFVFGLIALIIAVSIFTTMLTAMSGLCAWFQGIFGKGIYCPIIVLIAALILSRLGFNNVVSLLYPIIGVLGLFYIAVAIIYAVRVRVSAVAANSLFNKRNNQVHKRRHHAQNHSRSHNKV